MRKPSREPLNRVRRHAHRLLPAGDDDVSAPCAMTARRAWPLSGPAADLLMVIAESFPAGGADGRLPRRVLPGRGGQHLVP